MPEPTAREVLAQLVTEVRELTARVEKLETTDPDGWDAPFGLTDAVKSTYLEPDHEAAALAAMWTANDGVIEFAKPNEQQQKLRRELAPRIGFENLPREHGIDEAAGIEAYLSGGPMWLHLLDRDFVMTLAPEVRGAMVQDLIAGDHAQDAVELGRDILKEDGDSRRAAEVNLELAKNSDWQAKAGQA